MSNLVDYLRSVNEERCNVEPWTVAARCAEAAARIEQLAAAHKRVLDLAERHINEKHKYMALLREIAETTDCIPTAERARAALEERT